MRKGFQLFLLVFAFLIVSYSRILAFPIEVQDDLKRKIIRTVGEPDVRIAGVQTDKEFIYTDEKFSLSIQLENVGTGDAKSVKAELVDDNITGILTSYVGTIEVDDTGTAIFELKCGSPGEHTVDVNVIYEDEYGNQKEATFKAEFMIEKRPKDYTMLIIPPVVVIGIIYYFYRRWKRKKELKELVE